MGASLIKCIRVVLKFIVVISTGFIGQMLASFPKFLGSTQSLRIVFTSSIIHHTGKST